MDRDDQFRQAALELVGQLGYDCVTMDAIASKTRASKATLYRRWSSKEQLVIDALRQRIAPSHETPDTGRLASDLTALLRPLVAELHRDIDMALSLLAAARRDPPLMELLQNGLYGQFYTRVSNVVERAVQRGELQGSPNSLVGARAAAGIMLFRAAWNEGPLDAAFVDEIVHDIMLPLYHYEPAQSLVVPTPSALAASREK